MKCPCCESNNVILLKSPQPHLFCHACSHRRKSAGFPKDYYQKLSGRSKMLEDDFKKKNNYRLEFLKKYLRDGIKILEFGCAEGSLGRAVKRGFKVDYCGIEPSLDAREAKLSLDKVWKSINSVPSSERFDFSLSFLSLEHISNVGRVVSKFYKLLNDKGVIVAEVPCCHGNKLVPWDFNKEHFHLFSPSSISSLFERKGLCLKEFSLGHYESAIYNNSIRLAVVKRKRFKELKNSLCGYFSKYLGSRFVIYGLGGDFEALVKPYIKASNVLAVIDASKDKIGKCLFGRVVQGPQALNKYINEKFLIATYRYQKEILKLLSDRGVNRADIVTLEDIFKV